MYFQSAKINMIKQQLRTLGVTDEAVVESMSHISREQFVPKCYQSLAYADCNIPIGNDQVMLPPSIEARMLQEVSLQPEDRVLEIGTGTGYLTSVLAQLAKQVYSIEIFDSLADQAQQNLRPLNLDNIHLLKGDFLNQKEALGGNNQFDVIIATCGFYETPTYLLDYLVTKGRLIAIIGNLPIMKVQVITHSNEYADIFKGFGAAKRRLSVEQRSIRSEYVSSTDLQAKRINSSKGDGYKTRNCFEAVTPYAVNLEPAKVFEF